MVAFGCLLFLFTTVAHKHKLDQPLGSSYERGEVENPVQP